MLVYSEQNTERFNYTLNYLLVERSGISFSTTQSLELFLNEQGPKINYSNQTIPNAINIIPEGLLFEKTIRKKKPGVTYKEGIPIIFRKQGGTHFVFDIFSATFYFISRYEEYQPFDADNHGRFPAKESLAFKNIFLNQPVVDHWVIMFKNVLKQQNPELEIKIETFLAQPTIDIDSPWCYRHKGFLRNIGGIFRDLFYLQFSIIILRLAILTHLKRDPWYVFDWIKSTTQKNNLNPLLFIHVGKHGKYDKSVSSGNIYFRNFIRQISKVFQIGLHPSYNSAESPHLLHKELKTLAQITNMPVFQSRQHYLRIKLPDYYRQLIDAGITEDYSMGFADKPGFRAGTTRPFKWYDLMNESTTHLCIHPFAIMDRTVNTYEHQTVMGAHLIYNELIDQVKKVDGLFVTLWHNESFSNLFEWTGWRELFEEVMSKTAQNNEYQVSEK